MANKGEVTLAHGERYHLPLSFEAHRRIPAKVNVARDTSLVGRAAGHAAPSVELPETIAFGNR